MPDALTAQIEPTAVADPSKPAANATVNDDATVVRINTETATKADPARPAWLPEKFKSPEDMAKSYVELEKKLGVPKAADPVITPPAPAAAAATDSAPAVAAAEKAGFDMAKLSDEYAANGNALKPETIAALEKAGFPKEVVAEHIAGREALRTQKITAITEAAGGKTQMDAALAWASTNLNAAERDAVNNTFKSGDVAAASLAMQGVVARMTKALGTAGNLLTGAAAAPSGTGGVQPFGDNDEVVRAMKDPRYQTSAAYRDGVYKRLQVSNFAKVTR